MVSVHSSTPLTAIKGIGPVKQRRLQQALAIQTVQDLLAFDCDQIQARLAEVGPGVPPQEIQQWLQQARALAETEPAGDAPEAPAATVTDLTDSEQETGTDPTEGMPIDAAVPEDPSQSQREASAPRMNRRGTFQISVLEGVDDDRMTIEHVESGECYGVNPVSPVALYEWIWDHLVGELPEADSSPIMSPASKPAPGAEAPPPAIDILEVSIIPVTADSTVPGTLMRDQAFTMAVRFRLMSGNGSSALKDTVAVAQFYARNRLTGEMRPLAVVQDRVTQLGVAQYLQSDPVTLTDAGIYQIQVVVTLQNVRAAAGYQELHFIQVM
ncbi:hypothetical protein XM38_020170 [Halomicronema hongdechloris C2206]|uniref:DUF4332 domain-containing protein n=1 Tax=Halomicronema hongdechloris C2206 TaxID=1641165 RepID=A0A1Z3HLT6_9CYAN|nr:helix-hairpin-helix domain-containing protein [Halomicronema hongdechloris]ASC71067.1 hypothetical protein XM38_020170 [Halomicronema hongdechloris C2206]